MKKTFILLAGMLAVFALLLQPGNAVTNNTTAAAVSASVRETISVTLSSVPIAFGSLDAGQNNASANDPLNISIDIGTNVKTNISLNGTNFDCISGGCTPGSDTFVISYLRYSNASGQAGLDNFTNMSTSFPLPPYANWGNIAKPTVNTYRNVSFWLSIPPVQTGGNYQTNIYVNVSKYGG